MIKSQLLKTLEELIKEWQNRRIELTNQYTERAESKVLGKIEQLDENIENLKDIIDDKG